jgi:HD-GYP domain-containing protein (c-di-GMP phosphodiesterase class II)
VSTAELDPATEGLLEDMRLRRGSRLARRELLANVVPGVGFLVAALAAVTLVDSSRSPSPLLVVALIGAYALTYRVEFEVGSGLAVATQLVFVPMLFLLPLDAVPFAVAGGIMLANVTEIMQRRLAVERVLPRFANASYSLGPVAVLAALGVDDPSLRHWPVFLLALAAQFGVDFAAVAAHERIARGIPSLQLARYMSVTWGVDAALACVGLLAALVVVAEPWSLVLLLPLVVLLRTFALERRARIDHALELSNAYRGTAMLLGDVVEADDAYTGSHSQDVVLLSIAVAEELQLDARLKRDTEFVALLHDVGKIRIPDEIISKPGPLTPEERAIVETHTLIGEEMLDRVGGVLGDVGHLVRSCHERYDGSGYPDGLAGEEIPLVARIVCACDAYSAITSDRPYRAGRPQAEALAELRRCSGTHFDPDVVDALCRAVERLER